MPPIGAHRIGSGRRGRRNTDEDYVDNEDDSEFEDEDYESGRIDDGNYFNYLFHYRIIVSHFCDFSKLVLKPDHEKRPLWVCPNKRVYLETGGPLYTQAVEFLTAIAEPRSRPQHIHEYQITNSSLYSAVSVGLSTESIIKVLDRLSKVSLTEDMIKDIQLNTSTHGKVKLVLKDNQYQIESPYIEILRKLLNDPIIADAKINKDNTETTEGFQSSIVQKELEENLEVLKVGADLDIHDSSMTGIQNTAKSEKAGNSIDDDSIFKEESEQSYELSTKVDSFYIDEKKLPKVKEECLKLNYPLLEEYDFRNDKSIPNLDIRLRPSTHIRVYQERALSKMFGNGRARSGIIVLPCGAGKTLVGVTATSTMKKGTIVLCNSIVSVTQWIREYHTWSEIKDENIIELSSASKEALPECCVLVTTYPMLSPHKSNEKSIAIMNQIREREWGLVILDEVHVVPAKTFQMVVNMLRCHCKLGLTATLVREDNQIESLHTLIGPRLFEANWMDLTSKGYLATVRCFEVWCPMTPLFYKNYLNSSKDVQRKLCILNPTKFMTCKYLIDYHQKRGDKILVFSDDITALIYYAKSMKCPMIYGKVSATERNRYLSEFRTNSKLNCLFISRVGDTSIDLPEATVIIQIASHFGSRRQEAQRLGRILRPKTGSTYGYNAYFYSLVSSDTQDMFYADKRQQYLTAQGYTYKVIMNLITEQEITSYQQDLEEQLLNIGIKESDENKELEREERKQIKMSLGGDYEGRERSKSGKSKSNISTLSGGSLFIYSELSGSASNSGLKPMSSTDHVIKKTVRHIHPFFRAEERRRQAKKQRIDKNY
ncbi:hypothetical protein WA158_004951 [Blastocystis sp. Blastoise]